MPCINRSIHMMWFCTDFNAVYNISTVTCAECAYNFNKILETNVWACEQKILDVIVLIYIAYIVICTKLI